MAGFEVSRAGVILAVADVPRSVAFYRDHLGFAVDAEYDDPPYASLSRAGMRLSIAEQGHPADDRPGVDMAAPDPTRAAAVVVLEVSEALAVHAQLQAAGVDILAPVFSPPWGGHRFFLRDPDGHLVEIEQH